MTAKEMALKYKKNLIGKWITTKPMGQYPGGVAKVVALKPDPNAPEIVMVVDLPGYGEVGVFDHERVSFATEPTTEESSVVHEEFLAPTAVCPMCHAAAGNPTSTEWHWTGESWEHKCPDLHPQAGHFGTETRSITLDPSPLVEVEVYTYPDEILDRFIKSLEVA